MDSASVAESGTSSPGSRFKVDVASDPAGTMSPGSRKGDPSHPTPPPPLSPPSYEGVANGNGTTSPPPPPLTLPPVAEDAPVVDVLSPGSREGELSVPIIELPEGKDAKVLNHYHWNVTIER